MTHLRCLKAQLRLWWWTRGWRETFVSADWVKDGRLRRGKGW